MYLGVALNLAYALMTLLTASRKSFSVAILRLARMANIPASVQTLRISAPETKNMYVAFLSWLPESAQLSIPLFLQVVLTEIFYIVQHMILACAVWAKSSE